MELSITVNIIIISLMIINIVLALSLAFQDLDVDEKFNRAWTLGISIFMSMLFTHMLFNGI